MKYDDHNDVHVMDSERNWLDEIRLIDEKGPALRLTTKYRYKTSGMSGDEWRTSVVWQAREDIPIQGDWEADPRCQGWNTFDGGYNGGLQTGCAALYPGLVSSQPQIHGLKILRVEFLRKGRLLYSADHDGEARPLLTVAGHLPWALVGAGDQPLGTNEAWDDMLRLCHQPGCNEPAVSTYRLKSRWIHNGRVEIEATATRFSPAKHEVGLVHRFCPLHLRRGDCGRQDADENYLVVDGPGPSEAKGWGTYVSEAVTIAL